MFTPYCTLEYKWAERKAPDPFPYYMGLAAAPTIETATKCGASHLKALREVYEKDGWHTEPYQDGFAAEKNGNWNTYYGLQIGHRRIS